MNNKNHYTSEQVEWIKANYYSADSYKELAERFNQKFNTNRTVEQLRLKCNKNLKLKGMPSSSKYGRKKKEELPIGTIRKSITGTYIKVKMIDGKSKVSGYKEPYWLPLQKKIYQDKYGKINDNEMICFLDGDTNNFDIDNLYCINRKISAVMSTHKWWTNNKEHTLTAIKWCELYFLIKEREKNA